LAGDSFYVLGCNFKKTGFMKACKCYYSKIIIQPDCIIPANVTNLAILIAECVHCFFYFTLFSTLAMTADVIVNAM